MSRFNPNPLPIDRLREALAYSPETGEFRWAVTRNNNAKAGDVAGFNVGAYRNLWLDGKTIKAHRAAIAHVTGIWPQGDVDHIDGNPGNNRISNLRVVSKAQNLANQKRSHRGAQVGLLGVSRNRKGFRAVIQHQGRQIHLGTYRTPEEASRAYWEVKAKLHGVTP